MCHHQIKLVETRDTVFMGIKSRFVARVNHCRACDNLSFDNKHGLFSGFVCYSSPNAYNTHFRRIEENNFASLSTVNFVNVSFGYMLKGFI